LIWGCEKGVIKGGRKYLPFVSGVCAGAVVGEGFGAGELVVGGGGCDDVALGGDLAGETGDGAGYFGVLDGTR
jgi:hypothetical protein